MGWFDGDIAGNEAKPRDPFGRLPPDPEFDAFRSAWKAGSSLIDLFSDEPSKLKQPVGPEAPNRRADVAKVETLLGRTGHLDLTKTDGPTGYYGSGVDQGIRGFQKDNALRIDGLIKPDGPTLKRIAETLSENLGDRTGVDRATPAPSGSSLIDRLSDWLQQQASSLNGKATPPQPLSAPSVGVARHVADHPPDAESARPAAAEPSVTAPAAQPASSAHSPETMDRPVISEGRQRIQAIIEDKPAVFNIGDNPNADASDPWYVSTSAGRTAVATFESIIDEEARWQKVDPDLVKAIVFAENARGHYWGFAKATEGLGTAKTIFPMNMNPEVWGALGIDKNKAFDPRANIRAGVTLIKRLIERLEDASPEKVGTVYNSAAKERVTDYGAYVGRVYREKPWSR